MLLDKHIHKPQSQQQSDQDHRKINSRLCPRADFIGHQECADDQWNDRQHWRPHKDQRAYSANDQDDQF